MPAVARSIIRLAQYWKPSGSRNMATRRMANEPSFINTPAWSMDTAVGAATWPTGDQVWSGQTAASTPNPKNRRMKATFCTQGVKWAWWSRSMLKVLSPELA
jgi:hypothetical protein